MAVWLACGRVARSESEADVVAVPAGVRLVKAAGVAGEANERVKESLTDDWFPATSSYFADRAAAADTDHVLRYLQLTMPASPLELAAARVGAGAKPTRPPECFLTVVYRGAWDAAHGAGDPHVPVELRLTKHVPTPIWRTTEGALTLVGLLLVAVALAALRSSPAKPTAKQS